MKNIALYSALATLALAVGCTEAPTIEPNIATPAGVQTITALTPAQTKIEFTNESATGISLAWEAGDSFSVYELNGKWIADFSLTNADDSSFSAAVDSQELIEGNSYIAVYPARPNAEDTYADYFANDFTASQEADATSLSTLNAACQMSDEFTWGEAVTFAHNKAIMTIQFDDVPAGETPTRVQFSDGNNKNYELALNDMSASEGETVYEVNMMIEPSESVDRSLTFTITHTAGVNIYNIDTKTDVEKEKTAKAYIAGKRYTAPLKNQAEQAAKGYWQAVGTANELVAFLADPTKNTILTADIDMSGVEVAAPSVYLGKIFDGNGHTISNLTISATSQVGLFKGLNGTGVVKNLTLESPSITGVDYIGAIAGKVTAGAVITNCAIVDATIEATNNNVGGIAGQCAATISNSSFSGSVNAAKNNAGGIVGMAAVNSLFTGCYVDATVTAGTVNAGGIVANSTTATISNCIFAGTVTATTNIAGGIIGLGNADEVIYGCVNKGIVIGKTKIGSIAGSFTKNATVVACYNNGVVGAEGTTTGSTGGLIGEPHGTTTVTGCYVNRCTEGKIVNGYFLGYVKAADSEAIITEGYYIAPSNEKNAFGTILSDIESLNAKVEAMNTAINATAYADYNFAAGIDATSDIPTLYKK